MINIDPIRATVAPYMLLIKLGLLVVLAASMFIGGCHRGAAKWQGKFDDEVAAHKATKASNKTTLDNLAALTRANADKAKAASVLAQGERTANDKRFKEAKDEAAKARAALARALRAGTVQLRKEWTCSATGSAQGGAAAAAGGQDEGAELRRTREGAVLDAIDDADEADRWVGWLQSELISTRTACGIIP